MKTIYRTLAALLALVLLLGLCACGAKETVTPAPAPTEAPKPAEQPAPAPEAPAPVDADPDAPSGKPVLLVVSFGSSYNETRDACIGGIENALADAFPDYEVRRAFTAQTIIDILKQREGIEIDNVSEAMARLIVDGVKEVIVQPTHVMPGYEYDDMVAEVSAFAKQFDRIRIGQPLLTEPADFEALADILAQETAEYDKADTAIVYMGHGTEHSANETYAKMQEALTEAGHTNYFVGTVEAEPTVEDVLEAVEASGAQKVVLLPLMVVAGDHANNDMAGDEEDSWKTIFETAGFAVEPVLKGLGEYAGVRQMVVDHCGATIAAPDPLTADQIADGVYNIDVESSSTMFKVVNCELTVANGSMTAVITMSGTGYGKVFVGTAAQAEKADASACIEAVETADGVTFAVPVEALNDKMDLAAWSIKKETWYDRTLVFQSANIPDSAIKE